MRRKGRGQGRESKNCQAHKKHLAVTNAVAQGACAEEEGGDHQWVGIDDPQALQLGCVELLPQNWQGSVEHRVIYADE